MHRTRLSGQTIVCAWCPREFPQAARGRIPKSCSQACRQRAWQQRRAARSGLAAVDVVQRTVQVEKPFKVKVGTGSSAQPSLRSGMVRILAELADQLDRGRVFARHTGPRTTEHYDRARGNLDRHGVRFLTAYVAGV